MNSFSFACIQLTGCWVRVHLYYKFAANPLKVFPLDDGRTQGDCPRVSHVLWTGSRFIHAHQGAKSSYTTFLVINRIRTSIHTLSACRYVPLSMLQPVADHDKDDHYDDDDDADSNQCHNTSRDFRGGGHYWKKQYHWNLQSMNGTQALRLFVRKLSLIAACISTEKNSNMTGCLGLYSHMSGSVEYNSDNE